MIIRNLTNHQRNSLTVSAVQDYPRKLLVRGTAVEVESYFKTDEKIMTIIRIRGWDVLPFLSVQNCFKGAIIEAVMVYDSSFNNVNFYHLHHILRVKKIQYSFEDVLINGKT